MKGAGIRLTAIFLLAAVVLVAAPFVGMKNLTPGDVIGAAADAGEARIFWSIRVPRVLLAFVAGAALSLGGMAFQALFRNPLATPFTLGVSGGAAFGATLYIRLGISFAALGVAGISIFAFAGALTSILLVYSLTRLRQGASGATMLLAGVAISFSFSSLILFVHYTSDMAGSFNILRWLMGRLDVVGYDSLRTALPLAAIGAAIVLLRCRELDLMTVGEDVALSRGVDVRRDRRLLFAGVSLSVGGVVAICGPIGFVGMMAPHICRLLVGADHRRLAPASLLFGGTFLAACDTLARTVIAPAEIPVGVVTSLLGGPFFLWLLVAGRGGVSTALDRG